ncbi:MAG: DUF4383 domain-containing protein [Candidatus Competibacteraceae bacterium]|jgi:hypothetical protein|nr:DUF4383 domain-containing protein [Candidatus Competibacteraceae bacterium]
MNMLTSKNISLVFGITFLAVGILGFVPNPLVSPDGVFAVNTMHNLVHILTAGVFIAGGWVSERGARLTLQSVGIAYVVVTILGFLTQGHLLLGLVHINEADKWLHAGLAVVIVAAGFGIPKLQSGQTLNVA